MKQILNPENCQIQKLPVNLYLNCLHTHQRQVHPLYISIIEGVVLWSAWELVASCVSETKQQFHWIWMYRLYRILKMILKCLSFSISDDSIQWLLYCTTVFLFSMETWRGTKTIRHPHFKKRPHYIILTTVPQSDGMCPVLYAKANPASATPGSRMMYELKYARLLSVNIKRSFRKIKSKHTEAMASCCWVHVEFGLRTGFPMNVIQSMVIITQLSCRLGKSFYLFQWATIEMNKSKDGHDDIQRAMHYNAEHTGHPALCSWAIRAIWISCFCRAILTKEFQWIRTISFGTSALEFPPRNLRSKYTKYLNTINHNVFAEVPTSCNKLRI